MPEGLKSGFSKPSSQKHSWGWKYQGKKKAKPIDFKKKQKSVDRQKKIMALKRKVRDVTGSVSKKTKAKKAAKASKKIEARNTAFTKAKKLGVDVKKFESSEGYKHRGLAKAVSKKERSDYTKSYIADRDKKISERRKQLALKKATKRDEKAKQKSVRVAEKAEKKKQFALKMGKWSEQKKKDWKPFSYIDRKVDKEVEKYRSMYGPGSAYALNADKAGTKKKQEQLNKLEKQLASTKGLPSVFSDSDTWEQLSEDEKAYYSNTATASKSQNKRITEEINTLRLELGMDPLGYEEPVDKDLALHGPPSPTIVPGAGTNLVSTGGVDSSGTNLPSANVTKSDSLTFEKLRDIYLSGDDTAIAALDSASGALVQAGTSPPPIVSKTNEPPQKMTDLYKIRAFIRKYGGEMTKEERDQFMMDGIVPERLRSTASKTK